MTTRLTRFFYEAPAYWLASSALLSFAALIGDAPALWAHRAGWRAAAGPLVIAVLEAVAAGRLLRDTGGVRLGAAALALQAIAISVGPIAYRLVAGPYVTLAASEAGWRIGGGLEAHLLLILGAGNRVPAGLALNLSALLALTVLLATRSTSAAEPSV